jgi:predicted transcriptional regulator
MLNNKEQVILKFLSKQDESIDIEEISRKTKVNRNSAYRVVSYLAREGHISCVFQEIKDTPGRPKQLYKVSSEGLKVLSAFDEYQLLVKKAKAIFAKYSFKGKEVKA